MKINKKHLKGFLALSPILVFLIVYLVSSIAIQDFYKIPISAAFLLASIYAIIITKGTIKERIEIFSSGAGNHNVLLMIWIFILAGAFAATAKDIGSIEAMVALTLKIIPAKLLFAGLFLTTCFISFAIGTSVGTIVALTPIAAGIANQTGCNMAETAAIIVGGAFFGDNLSFISDTTIASTQALGCSMKDKFRANIKIALPAVVIVLGIYLFKGSQGGIVPVEGEIELLKILPYILVIVLALLGLNVTLILTIGIVANAIIGFLTGSIGWTDFLESSGGGIAGMGELIIVTLLAGGMLALIKHNGGLHFLIGGLTKGIRGRKGAELSLAALVSFANVCTANNTIAIITTGEIARYISDKFDVSPRKAASIMDTFSCMVQGILPYGAQLLMAASLCDISSTAIIPYLYYPIILGLCAIIGILVK